MLKFNPSYHNPIYDNTGEMIGYFPKSSVDIVSTPVLATLIIGFICLGVLISYTLLRWATKPSPSDDDIE